MKHTFVQRFVDTRDDPFEHTFVSGFGDGFNGKLTLSFGLSFVREFTTDL